MPSRFAVPLVTGLVLAVTGCSHVVQVGSPGRGGAPSRTARPHTTGDVSRPANQAPMPDVKGMTPPRAEQAVRDAGFPSVRFKTISRNEAPECRPGVVCQSNPPAGTMAYLKMPKVLYVVSDVCYHPALDDPQARFECDGANDEPGDDGGGDAYGSGGGDDEY